jgi:RNA polymerase sigma factor (sigma-70 family)
MKRNSTIISKFDADEAHAHIILVRDGLESINIVFEGTKFIPNKYIWKYSRHSNIEDIAQIAYAAHIFAIQTFPLHSTHNFFGWAGHTIRREIIDSIRIQKRNNEAADKLKKYGISLISESKYPEEEYFNKEFDTVINAALAAIGNKGRRAIIEGFLESKGTYTDSYHKRRQLISAALARLSANKSLQDFI